MKTNLFTQSLDSELAQHLIPMLHEKKITSSKAMNTKKKLLQRSIESSSPKHLSSGITRNAEKLYSRQSDLLKKKKAGNDSTSSLHSIPGPVLLGSIHSSAKLSHTYTHTHTNSKSKTHKNSKLNLHTETPKLINTNTPISPKTSSKINQNSNSPKNQNNSNNSNNANTSNTDNVGENNETNNDTMNKNVGKSVNDRSDRSDGNVEMECVMENEDANLICEESDNESKDCDGQSEHNCVQQSSTKDNLILDNEAALIQMNPRQISAQQEQLQFTNPNYQSAYKFIVFNGNYPLQVKNSLYRRNNFCEKRLASGDDETFDDVHFIWKPTSFTRKVQALIDRYNLGRKQTEPIIINHLEHVRQISTKTGLIRSLKRYYKCHGPAVEKKFTVFDATPTTFILMSDVEDNEYFSFVQRYKEISLGPAPKEKIHYKHCENNMWLVKPAAMNQGRGIEIFKNLREIKSFLNTKPQHTSWVVQKYIERPLLFHGRKFDIRIWALFLENGEVYIFKEGYLRTSASEYSLKSHSNSIHLTNNCLQKHIENYGLYEDGNTVSFEVFKEYIDFYYPQYKINFERDIFTRMRDLVIDTYCSVYSNSYTPPKSTPNKGSFELVGYDFLIDEDFRVWLIEVNSNPYLGVPNKYIDELLPRMFDELFEIIFRKIYPEDQIPSKTPKSEATNARNSKIKKVETFELIYSHTVNKRTPFSQYKIYPVPQLKQANSKLFKAEKAKQKEGKGIHKSKKAESKKKESVQSELTSPLKTPYKKKAPTTTYSEHTEDLTLHGVAGEINGINELNEVEGVKKHVVDGGSMNNVNNGKKEADVVADKKIEEKSKREIKRRTFVQSKNCKQINYPNTNKIILLEDQAKEIVNNISSKTVAGFFAKLANSLLSSTTLKEVDDAVIALKLIIKTRMLFYLVDGAYFKQLVLAALDSAYPIQERIRTTILELILLVAKDNSLMKALADTEIVHLMIKKIMELTSEKTYRKAHFYYYKLLLKTFSLLSNINRGKYYIPGETLENEKARIKLICAGGILLLYYISQVGVNEELKLFCQQHLVQDYDTNDLLFQINLIRKFENTQYLRQELDDHDNQRLEPHEISLPTSKKHTPELETPPSEQHQDGIDTKAKTKFPSILSESNWTGKKSSTVTASSVVVSGSCLNGVHRKKTNGPYPTEEESDYADYANNPNPHTNICYTEECELDGKSKLTEANEINDGIQSIERENRRASSSYQPYRSVTPSANNYRNDRIQGSASKKYPESQNISITKHKMSKLQLSAFLDIWQAKELDLPVELKGICNFHLIINDLKEMVVMRKREEEDKVSKLYKKKPKKKNVREDRKNTLKEEKKKQIVVYEMGIHEKETERSLVSDYRSKYKRRPDYSKGSETTDQRIKEQNTKRRQLGNLLKTREEERKAKEYEKMKKLSENRKHMDELIRLKQAQLEMHHKMLEDFQKKKQQVEKRKRMELSVHRRKMQDIRKKAYSQMDNSNINSNVNANANANANVNLHSNVKNEKTVLNVSNISEIEPQKPDVSANSGKGYNEHCQSPALFRDIEPQRNLRRTPEPAQLENADSFELREKESHNSAKKFYPQQNPFTNNYAQDRSNQNALNSNSAASRKKGSIVVSEMEVSHSMEGGDFAGETQNFTRPDEKDVSKSCTSSNNIQLQSYQSPIPYSDRVMKDKLNAQTFKPKVPGKSRKKLVHTISQENLNDAKKKGTHNLNMYNSNSNARNKGKCFFNDMAYKIYSVYSAGIYQLKKKKIKGKKGNMNPNLQISEQSDDEQ